MKTTPKADKVKPTEKPTKPAAEKPTEAKCRCLNKDKKPINAPPLWHGANCPVFLKEHGTA